MDIGILWRRMARIWTRDRAASELAEEMRLHLELRARQLNSADAAKRQFGNMGTLQDASASVWGWNAWERLIQGIRHAFRSLWKAPGFTAVAVATLALGLGVNTAVFSLVDGVMLHPLPYRGADRLVSLWEEYTAQGPDQFNSSGAHLGGDVNPARTSLSVANLADYRRAAAIEDIATFDLHPMNLTGLGSPERIAGEAVSANFFGLLGVEPALGRSFTAEDDRRGAAPVAMLTYDCWQRRLGGDTEVLARSIRLDEQPYQVIGVLPRAFQSPFQLSMTVTEPIEFYVPAAYPPVQLAARGDHDVNGIARLRPGVTIQAAQKELDAISSNLGRQFPQTNRNMRAAITPLREDLVRNVRDSLWTLMGAAGLIVLITCVNVANLLLARAIGRQHESSVRMALGAGRAGLARQFLTESLVLAAAGCAAGLAVGSVLMRAVVALAPADTPRIRHVTMDWRVFAVAAAVATLTGLAFGMAPVWQASRASAAAALATSARSTGARGQARWRAALTAAEVALSLILLVGAGLLLHSFVRLMGVDLGFQPERVLAMNVNLPPARYQKADERLRFFEELEKRVRALPGVRSVAFANRMPMRGGWSSGFALDGAPGPELECPFQAVSPGYFETLGIHLVRGRLFTAEDRQGQPYRAVVNTAFVRRFFSGTDPTGRGFHYEGHVVTIIGMVNDIRRGGKDAAIDPQVYLAAAQPALYPVRLADLAVRTEGDPRQLLRAIQSAVWSVDKDQPVTNARTLEEVISLSAAQRRFQMVLLAAFAAAAVLLATVGIFGVLSYIVSQRTGEMGIRMALGATPVRIVGLVLRQAGGWIGGGIVAGLAGAYGLARFMESLLFQVGRHDAWTYGAAAALMVAVALAAALVPARRGARVDPMKALRWE
jgi:predicted permease